MDQQIKELTKKQLLPELLHAIQQTEVDISPYVKYDSICEPFPFKQRISYFNKK